jgi:hypothetical protein
MKMTRKIPLLVALALGLALPAAASAYLPPGFVGVSPQSQSGKADFRTMREAGIESVRLPLSWASVERESPLDGDPDWSGFDREVGLAAEAGIRIMPFVYASPKWVASLPTHLPVRSAWGRWAWASFLRGAQERYGPDGSFWEENPGMPSLPIRRWEIWNEENLVTFADRPDPVDFATLVRISGWVLHRGDPGSKVILGGLFGRPLQIPPNLASGDFLNRLYRAGGVKPFFDGVALHPYVADARAIGGEIANLRRIMGKHGDSRTPLYITEMGWGSRNGPSKWERGIYGQAIELSRAFSTISAERLRWRIGGVWWFTWSDEGGGCLFCGSAGLLNAKREAKPSWYQFNAWTGGDPDTVPRAKIEE